MGLALLYAYRSQTPVAPEVSITQALQDINARRVRAVTIAGSIMLSLLPVLLIGGFIYYMARTRRPL